MGAYINKDLKELIITLASVIGKTVFLTREEAEKALEARKDG